MTPVKDSRIISGAHPVCCSPEVHRDSPADSVPVQPDRTETALPRPDEPILFAEYDFCIRSDSEEISTHGNSVGRC